MGGNERPKAGSAREAFLARLERLRARRRVLEERLRCSVAESAPDVAGIRTLRKGLQRTRAEIAHLERTLYPDRPA